MAPNSINMRVKDVIDESDFEDGSGFSDPALAPVISTFSKAHGIINTHSQNN